MPKFKVGDKLRITKNNLVFKKGDIVTVVEVDSLDSLKTYRCTKGSGCYWVFTEYVEPVSKFAVGQIYKAETPLVERWKGAIIRITEVGEYRVEIKPIRGEAPADFMPRSQYGQGLTLLTGSQIGEAIKAFDAKKTGVKEVKRAAAAGEYIKVVQPFTTAGCYALDDVLKVFERNCGGVFAFTNRMHPCHSRNTDESTSWLSDQEYVVLEGYSPVPQVKEVDREPKVGEYVKMLEPDYNGAKSRYSTGDVLEVKTIGPALPIVKCKNGEVASIFKGDYVVLEGYQPEKITGNIRVAGKHIYTSDQVTEAKRIVLDTIREYAEKDEQIAVHRVNGSMAEYEATIIHHNTELSTVTVRRGCKRYFFDSEYAISKCGPNDEPNEWIGKCVAICKLLGKPIPRFIMDNGAEKRFSFEKAQRLCDDGDIVTIRCKDEAEGDLLKAELEKLGVHWRSGDKPTEKDYFGDGHFVIKGSKTLLFDKMDGHDKFVKFSDCFTEI